ncbi:hypothetical protein [Metabacillus litoralis]|uniref:hypothetical protein n=1 Tax=Metabacillus litoralis TaxID=152268 RepID=UPI001CFD35FA|nr:hypothetical protein [Metabacillus litoralis]
MFLYHMVIHNDFEVNISPQRVLQEGLSHKTATRWYSKINDLFPELIEIYRPENLPKWVDFKNAFKADLEEYEKPFYRFPRLTDKILVFNGEITSDLFAYIEDIYDGGRGYLVEGLPSKEDLIKQYWDSMNTLDEYLKNVPYNNPDIYIFDQVPAKLIDYIE